MEKERKNKAVTRRNVIMVICMAVSLILLVETLGEADFVPLSGLPRPGPAQGNSVQHVIVVRENGEQTSLNVDLTTKQLTEEEAQEVFAQVTSILPELIKGENESLEQVTSDLVLPTVLEDWGIRMSWRSRMPDYIDSRGRLADGRDMETAEAVVLEVMMTLQEYDCVRDITVCVFPEGEPSWEERLAERLEQMEEASRNEETLILPGTFEGEQIRFVTSADSSKKAAVALLPAIVGLLLLNQGSRKEDRHRKRRREEITADYPELIIKMTVLYQAGLSMRGVWERIGADARKKGGKMRPIYEEVCFACNCMAEGISEPEVYRQFGRRCSTSSCLKLGNLLAGNVRRGTRQLSELMAQESARAWELRKQRARRSGEKAGTKMLIPMFMMFGVVLAMVVIPAFYSFMI
ncbi:MAG: type II secretion system F family protein [Lachnospiraceae bacterium]|nr:type II secretion system F family protein [Lachnospiraceae bacterium]